MALRSEPGDGGAKAPGGPRGALASMLASPRLRLALFAAVLVAASAGVILIGGPSPRTVARVVDEGGLAGPLVYVALYAVLTVLLFPGALITAAGGALFGPVLATALTVVGATLGATAAFAIGRRLGREQVERIAGPRTGAVDRWLERRGFLAVLYLRLIPLVPFNALNYAAGVTGVRRRDYVLGTALGIVPGAFAYAALGGSLDDPLSPAFLGAVGLVIALAVAGPLVDRLRRRRANARPSAPPGG
ncbi:MAG: TVP38/TMEM64 family protein [Actinomycetota bacterium]|nr:TVP38/TMEM64 family protein [Actinomycetota bacterium]